eukprot:3411113-Amphidinium_carterae.1
MPMQTPSRTRLGVSSAEVVKYEEVPNNNNNNNSNVNDNSHPNSNASFDFLSLCFNWAVVLACKAFPSAFPSPFLTREVTAPRASEVPIPASSEREG